MSQVEVSSASQEVTAPEEREPNRSTFMLPPRLHTARGSIRRAGFEFEFAGPSLEQSAAIVQQVFGGRHVVESPHAQRVEGTRYGKFSVETDSAFLKDKTYLKPLQALGVDTKNLNTDAIDGALFKLISTWVPYEIAAPPIPVTELQPLDELRRLLLESGAEGTRASLFYAFGLHINPELPDEEPRTMLRYLRAFLLLEPWLRQRVDVNVTRRIAPFINPFPPAYARLVLSPGYGDNDDRDALKNRLIDDYLAHNPTRNRPLDMLPVLSLLDQDRVLSRVEEPSLVKPRPAFHYRLPNCLIDEPDWSLAKEWNTWVAVERLAHHPHTIREMAEDFLKADDDSFRPFVDKWPGVLERYTGKGEPA
jgi:Putative amidoligase enzyme